MYYLYISSIWRLIETQQKGISMLEYQIITEYVAKMKRPSVRSRKS